ncbi:hypothetical protein C0J52_15880 [Blattella germanica]|nr:hypothetical protein C0J52_15880 [Blattella germanica]
MWAGFWQVLLRYFLAVLLGLSTARLWKLLRFIQQFCNFEHTLVRASKPLFFLVFMMFIIITACALFSYLFVSSATYLFSSILSSYTQVLIFGTGINEIKFDDFFKQDSFIGHAFLVVFWLLYVVYLINIFITILNISYEQSSAEIGLFREDYTMLDYIREEMHYICSCKKCKRSGTPRKELSVQEKYPHYFKQDISKTNSPSEDENLQKNDKRADVVFDGRLRAGSDVPSQPVFSPAIAVPKPNEIRKQNVELLPNNRLQSMQHLARYTIQEKSSQEDTHEQAIMSFIKSHIEHFQPKGTKEQGIFYRGLDGNEQKLVPNDKLLQMETVVNKLGAEIYAAKNVDYDDTSDDESIDDDNLITPTESYGYADVLALQFNRLDKILSDWDSKEAVEVEDSEIGDKQRTEEEHETQPKTSTQDHEIASNVSEKPSEIIQHPEIHKTTEPVGKISRQKPETIHPKDLITDQEDSDKEKIMSATRLPVQEHDSVQDIDTGTVLADSKDKTKRKDKQTKGIGTAAILGTTKPVRKDKTSSKPVKTDNRIKSHDVEKKLKDIMSHSEKTEDLNSQSKISNNGKEKEQYTETGPLEDAMIATTAGNLLYQNKRKESIDDKRNIKDKAKKRRLSKKKDSNQIKTTKHDNGMEDKVIEEEPITSKRVDALYTGKADYGTPKKTEIEMQDNQGRSPKETHKMVPDKFSTNTGPSRTTAAGGQPSLTSPVAALGTTPLKVIGSSPSTSTEAETSIKPMGNTYTVDYCGLFPLKKLVKEEKPTKENQQQPSSTSQTGAKRKTQQKIESFPIASDTHNPFAENLTPEYLARLQNVQRQLDSQRLSQVPESSARLVANRLQTYEINSNRAISYQPVSENQRNFTHIIQNSLPRHQERYVSQGFPSNASLLGNFTLHGHFSRTDGLRTNEENYHTRPDITFPQNNALSRTDEFRESEQSYPGHYLTRPSFFTRAERPLECDISYPREQNMYAEPIREQLLEAQIPEYSTTPELTNTIPLDMVTRQDLRMPIENSAMQQNRNFSEVQEAVESMYTPNMRLRQSTDTEGDLNRMVSSSNIRESANDADVRTRNSLIRTQAGLDELRIDLNNRNINVHNQAGREQRTNVGRNITGQNQISQQNQNNDRAQSRDRMFYTERQQQNESNRNRRGYRQGCSNTRTKRSTRNSEESATIYPLQTPCLVFPLPSPYVGLTYLSPVLPYSSNYMQPFASPGGQYWNQNDSRDLQFGFQRRQGYANTQYMPYERESHRHVRSQRYNRQRNIEAQESIHQGWQIPSQSEYTPNYDHARRGYGVDFTSENLSYSYSPMQRAHRQPGSVLPGAENSSTFPRWRPSASQHESGRGRRKMRSRRR